MAYNKQHEWEEDGYGKYPFGIFHLNIYVWRSWPLERRKLITDKYKELSKLADVEINNLKKEIQKINRHYGDKLKENLNDTELKYICGETK